MGTLVLLRHGESEGNKQAIFSGHLDVPLTDKGRREAREAAERMRGMRFDHAFTSTLQRATETNAIVLAALGLAHVPVTQHVALSERSYGALEGRHHDDIRTQYGDEQMLRWRRGYDTAPPGGESVRQIVARVVPYHTNVILPMLLRGCTVLVTAHAGSLVAYTMHLESLTAADLFTLSIPHCTPQVYATGAAQNVLYRQTAVPTP